MCSHTNVCVLIRRCVFSYEYMCCYTNTCALILERRRDGLPPRSVPPPGTHFTCFTSTKIPPAGTRAEVVLQVLTLPDVC